MAANNQETTIMSKIGLFLCFLSLGLSLQTGYALQTDQNSWGGSLGLSLENNYLGIQTTSGSLAFEANINYSLTESLYTGAAITEIDYIGHQAAWSDNSYQAVYLIGYFTQYSNNWAFDFSVNRYTYKAKADYYPNQIHASTYNYTELLFSADYRNRLLLSVGILKDLYQYEKDSRFYEFNTQHPISNRWIFNAGVGFVDLGTADRQKYQYASLGIGAYYGPLVVNLNYIATSNHAKTLFGQKRTNSRFNLVTSISF